MMGRRGEGDGMQVVKQSGKQNKWFGDQIKGKNVHKIMRSDQQFFVTLINLALIFKWCVVYYQRRRRQKTIKSSKAKAKSGEIKKSKKRIEYMSMWAVCAVKVKGLCKFKYRQIQNPATIPIPEPGTIEFEFYNFKLKYEFGSIEKVIQNFE